MRVLVDTNVILDVLMRREPHFADSFALLELATEGKLTVLITATSITDIHYLLRRSGKADVDSRSALQQLFSFALPADVRPEDIQHALQSSVADFEDAVAAEVAKRHQCQWILTRNIVDFSESSVPAMTPQEFMKTNRPD